MRKIFNLILIAAIVFISVLVLFIMLKNKNDISKGDFEIAILEYYNAQYPDDGNYVIFESETRDDQDYYYFIVRYQMTDEEANKKIRDGGFPAANIYVAELLADKKTGSVISDLGNIILKVDWLSGVYPILCWKL